MDTIKPSANMRFDLVDMQRLIAGVHEALNWIAGKTLGNPAYYTTAGGTERTLRPLLLYGFNCTSAGLVLTAHRTHTVGGQTHEALAFDGEGYRIAGPRSSATKAVTVVDNPGTHYLWARRVVGGLSTTTETRRHYSAALGEYPLNIDTEILDDWEIADSRVAGSSGFDVSAHADTHGRDGLWIDIATFETDGAGNIINLEPYIDATGTSIADALDSEALAWASAPPDPDRTPLNLFELISAGLQLIRRMRFGTAAAVGPSRDLLYDPTYDACFEEEGGLRFAGGETATAGLQNSYLRALATNYDQLTSGVHAMTGGDADDFRYFRGQGFIAGGNTGGGVPDPTNNRGFMYSGAVDGVATKTEVSKYWDIAPTLFCPARQNADPWSVAAGTHDHWVITSPTVVSWKLGWTRAAATSRYLVIPVSIPDKGKLAGVKVYSEVLDASANLDVYAVFVSYNKTTGATAVVYTNTYTLSVAGLGLLTLEPLKFGVDGPIVVDNSGTLVFSAHIYLVDSAGGGGALGSVIDIQRAESRVYVREASHVY